MIRAVNKATNSTLETDQDLYEIFIILVDKIYLILPQFESRPWKTLYLERFFLIFVPSASQKSKQYLQLNYYSYYI